MGNINYAADFKKACQLAIDLGFKDDLKIPETISRDAALRTDEKMIQFLHSWIYQFRKEEFIGNCLNVNNRLQESLLREIEVDSIVTFGFIKGKAQTYFEFTEEDMRLWMKSGIPNWQNINFHVWLTLKSNPLVMLDATFYTTYGTVNKRPDLIGIVLHGFPEQQELEFHPVIAGKSILSSLGLGETHFYQF